MRVQWLVSLTLIACLAVCGCTEENPVVETPPQSPLDDLVIANCYAVQEAAEAFAADNGNSYPDYTGGNLADYFPQGVALENPHTNLQTVPVMRTALYPGETGYLPLCLCCGRTPGYVITSRGANGEVIALSNLPRDVFCFEEQTVLNALIVQAAVEAFAADNDGVYPDNVNVDKSLAGKTVTDYLPGGTLLRNPYTGALV